MIRRSCRMNRWIAFSWQLFESHLAFATSTDLCQRLCNALNVIDASRYVSSLPWLIGNSEETDEENWQGGWHTLMLVSRRVQQRQIAKPDVSSDAGSLILNVRSRYLCVLIRILLNAM